MTAVERGPAAAGPRWSHRARGGPNAAAQQRRDERRTVTVAFAAALVAFAPTGGGAFLVAGGRGLFGALVGTLLVLVLFGMGAVLMLWAGRRGASTMTMVAAGGVGARLMIYAAVLTALDGTDMVHRPSLAVATVVTLTITLAGEIAVLSRTPSLFRLQVPPTAPTARPPAAADGRTGRAATHGPTHREDGEVPHSSETPHSSEAPGRSEAPDRREAPDVSTDRSTAS